MRTFDFAPLYRSTVGFERLESLLDRAMSTVGNTSGYPPYDIEKTGENNYRITVAVAGFTESELSIEMRERQLLISAAKARPKAEAETTYLHKGIATRTFEKRFQLADHVRAVGASVENGLLHVELVREIPEALKPRRIEIARKGRTIEGNTTH